MKPFTPKDPAKYELAHRLYDTGTTLAEIASRVGVGVNTVSTWKERGRWAQAKALNTITPRTIYNKLLAKLNELVEEEDPAFHADAIAKIAKQLRTLMTETTVDQIIAVLTSFGDWLINNARTLRVNEKTVQEITRLQDAYITYQLNNNNPL